MRIMCRKSVWMALVSTIAATMRKSCWAGFAFWLDAYRAKVGPGRMLGVRNMFN